MEPFVDVLAAGGHTNSLGRAGEVLAAVQDDPGRLDELFACIHADDAWTRMRAVDVFEKAVRADPVVGEPYVERIVAELMPSEQPSVQWHVAQLLVVVALTDAQRRTAVAWLQERIATTDVDWIVAVNSMRALLDLRTEADVDDEELRRLVAVQQEHHSQSVRRKAQGFLEEL